MLLPEALEVLDLVAKADRCLATAHLSPSEILPLLEEARARGVRRIIISHALWRMVGLTRDQLRSLVTLGAVAEEEKRAVVGPLNPHGWASGRSSRVSQCEPPGRGKPTRAFSRGESDEDRTGLSVR